MDLIQACSVELVKIAAEPERKKSYLAAMAATAPIAAMQSAADVPEGWAEKSVELRLKDALKVPILHESSSLRRGLARAAGRLSAATITTPLFLKGMADVKNAKNHEDRLKGYGEVVGAGMGFAGTKGAIEAGLEHAGTGKGGAEVLRKIRSLAGARTLVGAGSGLLTAATAAEMLKRQEKNPDSAAERYVMPAIAGAAMGTGKAGVEHLMERGLGGLATPALRNEALARAGGKATGGLMAGVLFNEIFRHAFGKEKKANADSQMAPQPSQIYGQAKTWATSAPVTSVQSRMREIPDPEATPSRRAAYYGMYDALSERRANGEQNPDWAKLPPLQKRDQTNPPMKPPTTVDTGLVAAAIAAPTAVWTLGVAKLKPSERDRVLADSVDRMILARGIERVTAKPDAWGNPDTFFELGERPRIHAAADPMPESLAHELGHASAGSLRKKTIAAPEAQAVYQVTAAASVLLSLFAIEGFNDTSFTTPADLEARAKFISGVGTVAALLELPHLAEEGAASVKAFATLQHAGATPREALFKGLRTLGPAFATYAAPAAAPFLAAAYLRRKASKGRAAAQQEST